MCVLHMWEWFSLQFLWFLISFFFNFMQTSARGWPVINPQNVIVLSSAWLNGSSSRNHLSCRANHKKILMIVWEPDTPRSFISLWLYLWECLCDVVAVRRFSCSSHFVVDEDYSCFSHTTHALTRCEAGLMSSIGWTRHGFSSPPALQGVFF